MVPAAPDWARARSVLGQRPVARAEPGRPRGRRRRLLRGPDRRRRRPEGTRGELALRLLGKPTDWVRFHAANVIRHLARRLPPVRAQAEHQPHPLRPAVHHQRPRHARPRATPSRSPPGTFRVAVLGSSIDMGWGVGTDETYVNRLEDWLNAHAERRGLAPPVRGAELRRRRLQPAATARGVPPQGRGVPARPGALLGDDARHPAAGDPPLRPAPGTGSTCATTSSARRSPPPASPPTTCGVDARGTARSTRTPIKAKLRPYYWAIYDDDPGGRWRPSAGRQGVAARRA